MFKFPSQERGIVATAFRTPDGKKVFVLVNPNQSTKKQLQLREGDTDWYVELLPNTVSTVVMEKER